MKSFIFLNSSKPQTGASIQLPGFHYLHIPECVGHGFSDFLIINQGKPLFPIRHDFAFCYLYFLCARNAPRPEYDFVGYQLGLIVWSATKRKGPDAWGGDEIININTKCELLPCRNDCWTWTINNTIPTQNTIQQRLLLCVCVVSHTHAHLFPNSIQLIYEGLCVFRVWHFLSNTFGIRALICEPIEGLFDAERRWLIFLRRNIGFDNKKLIYDDNLCCNCTRRTFVFLFYSLSVVVRWLVVTLHKC